MDSQGTVVMVPLEMVLPSKGNRKIGQVDAQKLGDLVESVRAVGILQPLIVRPTLDPEQLADLDSSCELPDPDRYEVVAGSRRLMAARQAGLAEVPVIVRDLTGEEAAEIQAIENLQREDLHPMDECAIFEFLLKTGTRREELAARIGKSEGYIYNRLQLRNLVPEIGEMYRSGQLSSSLALLLAKYPPETQAEIVSSYWFDPQELSELGAKRVEQDLLARFMLELDGAAFPKDDQELYPEAGACSSCPKRSGHVPGLFPELTGGQRCLDAACFGEKQQRFVAAQLDAHKGEKLAKIMGPGAYAKGRTAVLPTDAYEEVKKRSKGAEPAIVVDGKGAGRITYVRIAEWAKQQASGAGDEKEREQKRRLRELTKRGKKVRSELVGTIKRRIEEVADDLPTEVVRLVARRVLNGNFAAEKLIAQLYPLEERRKGGRQWDAYGGYRSESDRCLEAASRSQLWRIILYSFIAGQEDFSASNYYGPQDSAVRLADAVGAPTRAFLQILDERDEIYGRRPRAGRMKATEASEEEGMDAPAEIERVCRVCGCTEDDCRRCAEKTGEPCRWVEPDLCSACAPSLESDNGEDSEDLAEAIDFAEDAED